MKRLFLIGAGILALTSCASGLKEHAGDPPPANYRTLLASRFHDQFKAAYRTSDAGISEPWPGARDVVSGWRVCVEATPTAGGAPVHIAYFFVDRRVENVEVADIKCNGFSYAPWPELNGSDSWSR